MRVIEELRRILPRQILSRQILPRHILPRWIDMLSPAVLSAVAAAFLLSFGYAPAHRSVAPQVFENPSHSASALIPYHAESASQMNASPARSVQLAGSVVETVLICATPHADSADGLPFAAGHQPILCTFKRL